MCICIHMLFAWCVCRVCGCVLCVRSASLYIEDQAASWLSLELPACRSLLLVSLLDRYRWPDPQAQIDLRLSFELVELELAAFIADSIN
jgi:hypothetical protein